MGSGLLEKVVNCNYKVHILVGLAIRLVLVGYSVYHDNVSVVKYTDVDYSVFIDASRHIIEGESPYDRHTYRYSPIVALILIPNVLFHPLFGKFLFCVIDVLVALLLNSIIKYSTSEYYTFKSTNNQGSISKIRKRGKDNKKVRTWSENAANIGVLCWMYNPLSIGISTRGNCDSIAGFFVLFTVYLIQCKKLYFLSGLVHGLSIHFRLYPIAYSLTLYMFLSDYSYYFTKTSKIKEIAKNKTKKKTTAKDRVQYFSKIASNLRYFWPNLNQLKLVLGCLLSLFCSIGVFYYLYGYKFLFETYIYHLVRKDTRHNFSLYFYLQYLSASFKYVGFFQKLLVNLPQVVLLVVFSFYYGLNRYSLSFGLLIQTIVIVAYNSVLTSQYFVWIMVVFPLCVWQVRFSKSAFYLVAIWFGAQAAWLYPAYLLEFKGQNTFLFLWIQSVAFFCANIAILGRLIRYFEPPDLKIN